MSIFAAASAGPITGLWLVWLGAAGLVALFTGILRPRGRGADAVVSPPLRPERRLDALPLLAVAAIAGFCAWVGATAAYMQWRPPTVDLGGGEHGWAAADLTRVALLSALAGWAAAFGTILYGGGVGVVGAGRRRLLPGLQRGVLGIFVAMPFVYFTLEATLWAWHYLSDVPPHKQELLKAIGDPANGWVHVLAIVAAVAAAPLFEELVFRGCVQNGLRRATRSPWLAIGLSSLLFAAIHPKWTRPAIFVLSVMLGLVYERTRNLWAVTVMHALFNAFSVLNSGPD